MASKSKPMQLALVIPPAIIRQYEKQYNAKITQKNYADGMKEHGLEQGEKVGPSGWIDRFNSMAEQKKITLYTKNLPSKYHTYRALFHELQHASGEGYDDRAADAFAEKMLKEKKIRNDEKVEATNLMMIRQTARYKKKLSGS